MPNRHARLEELLQRLKHASTDEGAWCDLYRLMWPYVVGITYRVLNGATADAEDAAQEAFIKLFRSGSLVRIQSGNALRTYLAVIAQNTARDRLRALRRRGEIPIDSTELVAGSESSAARLILAGDAMVRILERLGDEDQQLVRLLIEGYRPGEIAGQLKITDEAARVRIHRLRRRIAKMLPEYDLGGPNAP